MGTIKGQNLRVMVTNGSGGAKCIAMALNATIHVSSQTEDSSTKDSTGDWAENEVVGLSWDVSTESLVTLTDNGTNGTLAQELLGLIINKTRVTLTFDQTSGTNNRTPVTPTSAIKCHGYAYLTDFSIQSQNRQNVQCSCQFSGDGALNMG